MSVPVAYIDCTLNLYYSGTGINEIRNNIRQNFGYYPSAALVHFWIDKYRDKAEDTVKNFRPQAGDTWIAGERPIRLNGKKLWLYEIIDDETYFLLSSLMIRTRTKDVIRTLMKRASEVARRMPDIQIRKGGFVYPSNRYYFSQSILCNEIKIVNLYLFV